MRACAFCSQSYVRRSLLSQQRNGLLRGYALPTTTTILHLCGWQISFSSRGPLWNSNSIRATRHVVNGPCKFTFAEKNSRRISRCKVRTRPSNATRTFSNSIQFVLDHWFCDVFLIVFFLFQHQQHSIFRFIIHHNYIIYVPVINIKLLFTRFVIEIVWKIKDRLNMHLGY